MPRVCSVCAHVEREAIDKALVSGTACREVAALYRVSPDAVERHKAAHLPKALTETRQAQDEAHALDVMAELTRCFQRVNLLFDACDRWLAWNKRRCHQVQGMLIDRHARSVEEG